MPRRMFSFHAKLFSVGRGCRAALLLGALWAAAGCIDAARVHEDAIVARVGTTMVYERDVRAAFGRRRVGLRDVDLSVDGKKALWRAAIDDLTAERMVVAAAREAHITVLEDEVDGIVGRLRRPHQGSRAVEAANQGPLAIGELRESARSYLLMGKYVAYQVASRLTVTEADFADYAEAHPEVLLRSALVRLRFLRLPSLAHVAKVRQAMGRGQAPGDAARESLGRPVEVGDLGLMAVDRLPQEVRRRTERLPLRKLSEPLPLDDEVAVFWVADRTPALKDTVAGARRRIERRLRREREGQIEQEVLAELKHAARAEVVHDTMPSDL